jgi:membrane-bound lytic murein transglycosylase A
MARHNRRLLVLLLLVIQVSILLGWWLLAPPEAGPLRLTPVKFSELPGWTQNDPRAALAAFRRSCAALKKKSPMSRMGGAGYAGSVGDWQGACAAAPTNASDAQAARTFFENWFAPVAVSAGDVREGLFTGYYEPHLRASRTRHGAYQAPIYGLPDDLISVDLGQFRDALKGEHIAGRVEGHTLVPYATRAEIDAKGVDHAPVLFYGDDPVTVFFLHIQGSGRVLLDDGAIVRVAYAGQNGQPYTAIGRTLIAQGALTKENVSLQTIRAWLKANPQNARQVMETDKSFVFFSEQPVGDASLGSAGSEGVALTAGASLAVDLRLHPLGAPFFVSTNVPDPNTAKPDRAFNRLLIAQDTGGAIKGPVRGDVFWGFGKDAEEIAGRMKSHGMLFVLLPKSVAAKLAPHMDYPESAK